MCSSGIFLSHSNFPFPSAIIFLYSVESSHFPKLWLNPAGPALKIISIEIWLELWVLHFLFDFELGWDFSTLEF